MRISLLPGILESDYYRFGRICPGFADEVLAVPEIAHILVQFVHVNAGKSLLSGFLGIILVFYECGAELCRYFGIAFLSFDNRGAFDKEIEESP
ncbi:hypothetical protein SDC9_212420 [bioreactor metagenome]|uniref:Uncharacterized protein n=1 Tax=bioreactor metagenome TaxID=1076179 RepID=A0A645JYW7_9ZZZZ